MRGVREGLLLAALAGGVDQIVHRVQRKMEAISSFDVVH